VKIYVYSCQVTLEEMNLLRRIPVIL